MDQFTHTQKTGHSPRFPIEAKCAESTKQCHFAPILSSAGTLGRSADEFNFEINRIKEVTNLTGLNFSKNANNLKSTFGPRDLFYWIYAILHSPGYRSRYGELLKSDFPHIPLPKGREIFNALSTIGDQLVSLHLLRPDEAAVLENPDISFHGTGEARVEKGYPKYENGKVMINPNCWFEDVEPETWEFQVGGYQVCHKWLKSRAGKGGRNPSSGRTLTEGDILHYRRTAIALTETRRLMAEIEHVIEQYGGWPEAFADAGNRL